MKLQQIPTTQNAEMIRPAHKPWVRIATKVFTVLYLWQSILPAYAQTATGNLAITPAASAAAGQRAMMDAALNGVPIAHIAPPSAAGVSRNQYDHFNVNQNGLILNNSANNVQSKLGGWISGNLQLGVTPARIILNEVVSSNLSQLRGTIEVAGQRADIVIANPNGISCDGCGFLNTGRSTLTTGSTQFAADGSIKGFEVRQGKIMIGSGGLNAANIEQLDLIARGMVIEGEVWAKNLNAIAGANQVLYGTLQGVSQPGSGGAPRFAIDIKELGGMYANQVYMVATERGLGVNSTGRIAALQGNLVLSANGDLSLKDSYAKQNIQIETTANAKLSGQTVSDAAIAVGSAGALVQQGMMESKGPLTIRAASLDNQGTISQRGADAASISVSGSATNGGSIYSGGTLALTADSISDHNGKLLASGDLHLQAQNINLSGSQLASDSNILLQANQGVLQASNSQINAGLGLDSVASGAITTSGGIWQAQKDIYLQAASFNNLGGTVLANGALTAMTTGIIENSAGKLLGSKGLEINASEIINNAQAMLASDQSTSITTTGLLSNQAGVISAKTGLSLRTTGAALNNGGGIIVSDAGLSLTAGDVNSDAGQIISRGFNHSAINIKASALSNQQGVIDAAGILNATITGALNNQQGILQAGSSLVSTGGSAFIVAGQAGNQGGQILARDGLAINAASINNDALSGNKAVIASTTGITTINAGLSSNRGGLITGSQATILKTQALDNRSGEISSAAALTIDTAGQALDNTGGRILANGNVDVLAGAIYSKAGQQAALISSGKNLTIGATSLSNDGSIIAATNIDRNLSLSLGTGVLSNTAGQISAANKLHVLAGNIDNQQGKLLANQSITLDAVGLDNRQGQISGLSDVHVALSGSTALNNTLGSIVSNHDLSITANALNNTRAILSAANAASLQLGSGTLDNHAGQVLGMHGLSLQSGRIDNQSGTIYTGKALAINTQGRQFDNTGGNIVSGGDLSITAAALNNLGGKLTSQSATSITSQALDNTHGEISALKLPAHTQSSGNLLIHTQGQQLKNDGGRIVAQGDLQLQSGSLSSRNAAVIAANGNAILNTTDLDTSTATLQAAQDLQIIANGIVSNANGSLLAGRDLKLQAAQLLQTGAASAEAGRDLTLNVAGVLSNSGSLLARANAQINAGSINNDGGSIATAQSLTITSGKLENRSINGSLAGQIIGTTALTISSQALDNSGGVIGSQGDLLINTHAQELKNDLGIIRAQKALTLQAGDILNRGANAGTPQAKGVIAANSEANILANNIDNTGGSINAGSVLNINASDALTNNHGRMMSDGSSAIQAASLSDNNAGRITAASSLHVDTAGNLNNAGGLLIANGSVNINSAALTNTGGTLASLQSDQSVNTHGQSLINDAGKLQAGGNLSVQAGSTSNQNAGFISAKDLSLNLGSLNNNSGQILAAGTLNASTLALSNNAGLIEAAGDASINTNGNALINTNSASNAGIVSAAKLLLQSGDINNQSGYIASSGNNSIISSGTLDNRTGLIAGNAATTVQAANIDNRGGRLNAKGDLGLNISGTLDNRGGNLTSNANALINAASLDNSSGTIGAGNLTLNANNLSNSGGAVRAANNATITAAVVDNSNGRLTAKNTLVLNAPGLNNANGYLVADKELVISTASVSFGGSVASQNNVTLNIAGDYSNTGLLSAQKNLTVNASNINNSGVIKANDSFTANAGNLSNSGEISATTTRLNLSGNLNNTGLIDGSTTQINANSVDNTGRIYGDQLSIQSGTLNNSGSGVLAARNTMFLGGGAVNNSNGASIYAYNDIVMAGSLGQNGQPTGELGSLLNASSSIEAGRHIDLSVMNLINRNDLLQTALHTTNTPVNLNRIQPQGSPTKYLSTELGILPNCDHELWCYVAPSAVYPIIQFGALPKLSAKTSSCTGSMDSQVCTIVTTYLPNDPIWALFQVPVATFTDLIAPVLPTGYADCMNNGSDSGASRNMSGACGSYWPAFDTYTQTVTQRTDAADAALDAKIAAYNADVQSRVFSRWTQYQVTERKVEETEIISTKPAQISAAGSISIQGSGSKLNDNSAIVAGGAITISGSAVENKGTQGTRSVTEIGQARGRDHTYHGGFSNSTEELLGAWVSTTGTPEVTSIVLSNYTYQANGGNTVANKTLAGSGALADASLAGSNAAASGNDRSLSAINVSGQLSSAGTVNQAGVSNLASGVAAQSIAIGSHSAAQAKAVDHSPLTILNIAASGTGERARDVILSLAPRLTLPNSSLFVIHPEPSSRTLIETDPRFTQFKSFISSDYYLQQLNKDPLRQLKRYGDGFYEQQLINDQILALTGRRFLSGYSSTEDEYKQLMNSGVAFAQRYQLSPGVALSAEQMANLSTDIVWLSTQTVTLANGQTEQVLVPQVYLRRPQGGDLQTSGALISASDISIQSSGNLLNSGSINASGTLNLAAGKDLVNQGGNLRGKTILARAGNDLKNLSGSLIGNGPDSSITLLAGRDILLQTRTIASSTVASATSADSSRTSIDRIATLQAGAISIDAGRDISAIGAKLSAEHNLVASAGRDLLVTAVQGQYQLQVATGGNTMGRSGAIKEASVSNLAASLSGENVLLLAQNDARISGSNLTAVNNLQLQAANIEIAAAKDRRMNDVQTVGEDHYSRTMRDDQSLVGANLSAGNRLSLRATEGNISLSTANLNAQNGQTTLSAKQDINILNASTEHSSVDDSYSKVSGMFSGLTTTIANSSNSSLAQASNVSGNSVLLQAGRDIAVQGSNIVGDSDVSLVAGNKVSIQAATSTRSVQNHQQVQETGFLPGGGFGISYGQRTTTTDQDQNGSTQSGQARSMLGSNQGSLAVTAGNAIKISGSDITAAQDISLAAKSVNIDTGLDNNQGKVVNRMTQDGLTLAVGGTVVTAIQVAQGMSEAAGQSKNSRVQALAAATAALAASNAAKEVAAQGASVSLTAGHAESQQTRSAASSSNSGSALTAGNNLSISATGGGKDSNINISGSDLSAAKNLSLNAEHHITLQAAQDLESQHSESKQMSAAAGVAASYSSNGGGAIGYTASVSAGKANEDGQGTTQRNTHVNAGQTLSLSSGGDTTLKGAVLRAQQVQADIDGNLNLQSLQDTARFDSKSQSANLSATVGYGVSVSGGVNQSKIHNDYASVQEQTGIQAGDQGFQIRVKGNTDLQGALISSSQSAVDQNKNSLTTASLSHSDIANHSISEANSLGLSGSASMGGSAAAKADAAKSGQAQAAAPTGAGGMKLMDASATNNTAAPSAMAVSSNDSSVTQSGISGGTISVGQQGLNSLNGLKRQVVSGTDSSGKIANNFNQADLQATLTVASAFIQQAAPLAAKLVGDIGESKQKAANKEADVNLSFAKQALENGNAEDAAHYQNLADQARANAASWGDNGSNRIALHAASQALIGGLSGGSAGALNSGSGALAGNLGQQLGASMAATEAKRLGLEESAASTLANSYQQSLATIGGALGGLIAGSASGQNGAGSLVAAAQAGNTAMAVDVYNRQLHPKEIDLAKKYAKQVAKAGHITEEEAAARIERQILRWTNADTNKFDGDKVDELVLSQIGISGKDAALGIAWDYKNFATKNSAEYNNSSINQQNVMSYSPLITQVNLGKTPAQYEQQERDGKVTALTAALCSVTLGGCAFMSGFNIGEGGTKIANGDTLAGSLQVGGGVLGLGGTIYAASKASIQTAAQVNAQGGTGGTGALITLGANTEKELAALTGLNGSGVYAPKTTGTSGGYTGLTVLDGNGNVIPNATLPSVGAKVGANRVAATEVGGTASGTGRSFWTNQTEFGGIKVFQRNDAFDPNLVTTWREGGQVVSGSNLERMATGRAPIGTDGKSVNLHHMLQSNDSAIAEMTQTFHQINSKVIHINPNTIPSGIDRPAFDIWRGDYWINRAATNGSQ